MLQERVPCQRCFRNVKYVIHFLLLLCPFVAIKQMSGWLLVLQVCSHCCGMSQPHPWQPLSDKWRQWSNIPEGATPPHLTPFTYQCSSDLGVAESQWLAIMSQQRSDDRNEESGVKAGVQKVKQRVSKRIRANAFAFTSGTEAVVSPSRKVSGHVCDYNPINHK